MNKQQFKVGDRVMVTHAIGIGHHNGQTGTIIPDKPYIIVRELGRCVRLDEKNENGRDWIWCLLEEIEPIETKKYPVIVITTDGKTTTATMHKGKKVIKTASATCSDKDTFDFAEGARVAFERLQGRDPFPKKEEEEKRPERPEKLVCVSKPRIGAFKVGKVYKPTLVTGSRFYVGPFSGNRIGSNYIVPFSVGDAVFIPLVED